jgi:peptidase inhibitor family I36
MKRLAFVLGLTLVPALLAATPGRPQNGRNDRRPGDRVCVYENNNFQGWEECFQPGDEMNDLRGRNNAISSIRIFGNAVITIFDNKNFSGTSAQVSSDVKDMAQFSAGAFLAKWNDRVESLRVSLPGRRPDPRDDRRDPRRPDTENVICVYEEPNYRGDYDCFAPDQDTSDLNRRGGWSDRISSIRLFGNARATAFVDIGYRGERLVIDRDIPDLKQMRLRDRNWNKQISSIEISGGRGRR